jgi:hypothetical protein
VFMCMYKYVQCGVCEQLFIMYFLEDCGMYMLLVACICYWWSCLLLVICVYTIVCGGVYYWWCVCGCVSLRHVCC